MRVKIEKHFQQTIDFNTGCGAPELITDSALSYTQNFGSLTSQWNSSDEKTDTARRLVICPSRYLSRVVRPGLVMISDALIVDSEPLPGGPLRAWRVTRLWGNALADVPAIWRRGDLKPKLITEDEMIAMATGRTGRKRK
jgi:hypothetical protein